MFNYTEMASIFWMLAIVAFVGGSIFCVAASLADHESRAAGGGKLRASSTRETQRML
jgi:hypothetical protein